MPENILLLETSKISNIGNAFLSKGAEATLKRSFPNSNIISFSLYSDYVAHRLHQRKITNTEMRYNHNDNPFRKQFLHINSILDIDLAVIPGCILGPHGLEKYLSTLHSISEEDIPILFLGVGGGNYEDETVEYVESRLSNLSVDGMITRDSDAYNCYSDLVEYSYDGIDNAFFIDEWHMPPRASRDFVAMTFDKSDDPDYNHGAYVVRPNHSPINWFQQSSIPSVVPFLSEAPSNMSENTFASDDPKDYLFIYANAKETHSDRVHACIPALVYGNKARFYHDTPRAKLFDKFFNGELSKGLVELDRERCKKLKQSQVDAVRDFSETILQDTKNMSNQ